MSTLLDSPIRAAHEDGKILIVMASGEEIVFPISGNSRLESASAEDLGNIELSPFGLHWPALDEDLSIQGIRRGNFGQVSD